MDYGFKSKVALVSGSSKGIGRAVAEALRQAGGSVHAVVGDATRAGDIEQVVAETVASV